MSTIGLKKPRVLITGSPGRIGQALIKHMLAAGTHEVVMFKPEEESAKIYGGVRGGGMVWLDEGIALDLTVDGFDKLSRAAGACASYIEMYGQGCRDLPEYVETKQSQNKTKEGFNDFLQSKQKRGRR